MKRVIVLFSFLIIPFFAINCSFIPNNSEEIARNSWAHYKQTFIENGRVFRPKNNYDTVSEGQAYGMLRAVLMNDRKIFNECLAWTEAELSRKKSDGDRLLAWHYEHGKVTDTKSASDADIDYAYSLILASRKWNDKSCLTLALEVLKSVLEHETAMNNGRLYLLPWPKHHIYPDKVFSQNPSYYAPSHFKLFFEVTGDKRWLELVDTTYYLLGRLLEEPGDFKTAQLVPDWITLDSQGNISEVPAKTDVYGWDAVRIPLRIAADYYLYGDSRALGVLRLFSAYFEKEYSDEESGRPYENALFYSAAYAATEAAGSPASAELFQRLRKCIQKDRDGLFFNDADDYYINSISWLPEYYNIVKESGKLDEPPLHAAKKR